MCKIELKKGDFNGKGIGHWIQFLKMIIVEVS
jgi:hypothetical protein